MSPEVVVKEPPPFQRGTKSRKGQPYQDIGEQQPQVYEQLTQSKQNSSKTSINYGQLSYNVSGCKRWTREQLAKLIGVTGSDVTSWEKNLSSPDRLSRQKLAERLGKDIYRTSQAVVRDTLHPSSVDGLLQILIHQERLTAQNFTTIISALTELHTQCCLIQQGRFVHAIEYAQTHNEQFVEEANLVITRLAYNSPLALTFAPFRPEEYCGRFSGSH